MNRSPVLARYQWAGCPVGHRRGAIASMGAITAQTSATRVGRHITALVRCNRKHAKPYSKLISSKGIKIDG